LNAASQLTKNHAIPTAQSPNLFTPIPSPPFAQDSGKIVRAQHHRKQLTTTTPDRTATTHPGELRMRYPKRNTLPCPALRHAVTNGSHPEIPRIPTKCLSCQISANVPGQRFTVGGNWKRSAPPEAVNRPLVPKKSPKAPQRPVCARVI